MEKVCDECYLELQAAWRLRSKIQFTDSIFRTYRNRLCNVDTVEFFTMDDEEVELACHECDQFFKYDDLLDHIADAHGNDHLPECAFCETLLACQAASNVDDEYEILSCDDDGEFSADATNPGAEEDTANSSDEERLLSERPAKRSRGSNSSPNAVRLRHGCHVCNTTYSRRIKLKEHLKLKHNILEVPEETEIPLSNEAVYQAAARKARKPKQETEIVYGCPHCTVTYTRKPKLKDHLLQKHNIKGLPKQLIILERKNTTTSTANEPVICTLCPKQKVFQCSRSLRRHISNTHKIEVKEEYDPKLECPTCHARLADVPSYQKHLLTHTPLFYPCSICDESFPQRRERRDHELNCYILDAARNVSRQCIACGEIVPDSKALKEHRQVVHNGVFDQKKPVTGYNCHLCDKTFGKTQLIMDHLDHHGSVACRACSKSYPNTKRLNIHHRNEHNGHAVLTCTECGKKLSRPEKLIEHMWTHTGFICNICQMSFTTRKDIYEHRREMHNKKGVDCSDQIQEEEEIVIEEVIEGEVAY